MQIKKEDVDRSQSGVECQLFLHWESECQKPAKLRYKVDLLGAKPPTNFFHIILDTVPDSTLTGILQKLYC